MPAPQSIHDRIFFDAALSFSEAEIRAWLDEGWDSLTDSNVRNMLLTLESQNRTLNFTYLLDSSGGAAGNTIYIDPVARAFSNTSEAQYVFDSDGTLFQSTLKRAIFHEMAHAIYVVDDGSTGANHGGLTPYNLATSTVQELRGPAVDIENAISAGLQDTNFRVSYAGWAKYEDLNNRIDISWTEGNLLSTALVDNITAGEQIWDFNNLGTSSDLFIGLWGQDLIGGTEGYVR